MHGLCRQFKRARFGCQGAQLDLHDVAWLPAFCGQGELDVSEFL